MGDRTRRGVLAGAGGLATVLAGCSVLDSGGDQYDHDALRRLGNAERFAWPFSFPLSVPEELVTHHLDRARALLERVPADPDVPNELVADELARRREELADELGDASADDGTSTPEGDTRSPRVRALDRVREARHLRVTAAALWGRYRAAIGDVTEADIERRRDQQRDRLAAFRSAWAYRAEDPVRATLVHEEFEHRVGTVERDLEPYPLFPDDPQDAPDEVGYLFEKVEEAAAVLLNVEHFHTQVSGTDLPGYRPALMAAATWLRRRARRETFQYEAPLERGLSAFDRDLGESVARYEFTAARDVVQEHSNGELLSTIEEERYANAALFAATRRAAVSVMGDVVEQIKTGPSSVDVSARTIEQQRERAHDAIESALEHDPRGLMIQVLEPANSVLWDARNELQNGAAGTPPRAYAQYRYAARFADAAVDAADELRFLLTEAAD